MAGTFSRSAAPARHLLAAAIGGTLAAQLGIDSAIAEPPPTTIVVTNCDDSGDGSLRWALAAAVSGDTLDLTSLQCSLITLTSGELSTSVDDLTLVGSGIAISGGDVSRVISHLGFGTLLASGIGFEHGSIEIPDRALGGCIYSRGNVSLRDVTASNCVVATSRYFASQGRGGGVYAKGAIALDHATIHDNVVRTTSGPFSYVTGAGISSYGPLAIVASTIANNRTEGGYTGRGGGFYSFSDVSIYSSTISGNHSMFAGGGFAGGYELHVVDSTISGNDGDYRIGGIEANATDFVEIRSSTITGNSVPGPVIGLVEGVGLLSWSPSNMIESSIIAGNTCNGSPGDLDTMDAPPIIGGANMIGAIGSVTTVPGDTMRTDDPMLAPLADNGGPTLTHALLPGSPAINRGDNTADQPWDQRGEGYPRVQNGRADIGAFELELPEEIFANGFDPPAQ
jgi:hypothetical protein